MFGKNSNFLPVLLFLSLCCFCTSSNAQSIIGSWELTDVKHFDEPFKDKILGLQFHFFENDQLIQESPEGYLLMGYQTETLRLKFAGQEFAFSLENETLILDNQLTDLNVKLILSPIAPRPIEDYSEVLAKSEKERLGDIKLKGVYVHLDEKEERNLVKRFYDDYAFVSTTFKENVNDCLTKANEYYNFIVSSTLRNRQRERMNTQGRLQKKSKPYKRRKKRKKSFSSKKDLNLPPPITPSTSRRKLQLEGETLVFRDTMIRRMMGDQQPMEYTTVLSFNFEGNQLLEKVTEYRMGNLIEEKERTYIFLESYDVIYWQAKKDKPFTAGVDPIFFLPIDYQKNKVNKLVVEMPRLYSEDCEQSASTNEKNSCSQRKMLEFIYKNIQYPREARKDRIEGTIVVQFVVDELGRLNDPKVVRDIGGGCGEEGVRIVNQMAIREKWTPGRDAFGNPQKVQFNMPIKFRLN